MELWKKKIVRCFFSLAFFLFTSFFRPRRGEPQKSDSFFPSFRWVITLGMLDLDRSNGIFYVNRFFYRLLCLFVVFFLCERASSARRWDPERASLGVSACSVCMCVAMPLSLGVARLMEWKFRTLLLMVGPSWRPLGTHHKRIGFCY